MGVNGHPTDIGKYLYRAPRAIIQQVTLEFVLVSGADGLNAVRGCFSDQDAKAHVIYPTHRIGGPQARGNLVSHFAEQLGLYMLLRQIGHTLQPTETNTHQTNLPMGATRTADLPVQIPAQASCAPAGSHGGLRPQQCHHHFGYSIQH